MIDTTTGEERHVNFIKGFGKLCAGTEIPPLFAFWCGLSGVSIALGRRVWIDQGIFKVFPNMYVVLAAGSGQCRKSTAISVLQGIAANVEPPFHFVSEKLTNEGLIDYMYKIRTQRAGDEGDKSAPYYSEAYAMVDELATFLDKKSYEAGLAATLIQMFDCRPRFEYRTKTKGVTTIQNVCLGLLGGSTLDWIRNAIPADAIGGGLTSRIIYVYVEKPCPPCARPSFTDDDRALALDLASAMQTIATVPCGPATLLPDAWEEYERLYNEWHETQGGESAMFLNANLAGYASRRFMHLLRIAMLLSVAEHPTRSQVVITHGDVVLAHKQLCLVERYMPRIMFLIASNDRGFNSEMVYLRVMSFGKDGISRELLMRSITNRLSQRELDEILVTLLTAGRVRRDILPGGVIMYYPT